MLTLFKRHTGKCREERGEKPRDYRRCPCPIHVEGSLGGEKIRKGLNQTSWEAAENLIRDWIKAGRIGAETKRTPLKTAVELFLAEAESRNLAEESVRLYRRFIGRQLPSWAESEGILTVQELTFTRLVAWKSSWKFKAATQAKRLELLKRFCRFCVSAGWMEKSPVESFKPPQSDSEEKIPFTSEEMKAILEACDKYTHHGDHGLNRPARVKAFVLLLRYSGLRIQDACCLETEKLSDENELALYTQKSGTAVYIPLPPFVAQALREQGRRNVNSRYFFWSGNGKRLSTVSAWQRTLRTLFKLAKVKGKSAHSFRHTLASELLGAGVPIQDVAAILGHSVQICEKHYAHWMKSRQENLSERIREAWPKEKTKLKVIHGGGK